MAYRRLLLPLTGTAAVDPVTGPALDLLSRRALRPGTAVAKLSRGVEDQLLEHLQRCAQIRRIPLPGKGLRKASGYPLLTRDRVDAARAALLAALLLEI